jgi:glycosyltransferase involved in cell wall biosynthesis
MKTILVKGPALSRSGYGEQTRFALRALRAHENRFNILLVNIPWGQTGWIAEDDEERGWYDHILAKGHAHIQQKLPIDISLQVTIPNEWERIAPINIGYTAGIETTKVAPHWIEKSRLMDKIIVVSNHSKNVYNNTTYEGQIEQTGEMIEFRNETPIEVVNYPVRSLKKEDLEIKLDYDFNFLAVAQMGPRKNIPNTVYWFIDEFHNEEVGLVLKTNIANCSTQDLMITKQKLKSITDQYPDRKCKIYLLHGDLTLEEMNSLYANKKIKSFITFTHGEGFGMPIFEAAYHGVPVIAPSWSGQNDFLYAPVKSGKQKKAKLRPLFCKVDYTLAQVPKDVVWDGVITADSGWCHIDDKAGRRSYRDMFDNYTRYKSQANKLKKHLIENFTEEKQYEMFADHVYKEEAFEIEEWLTQLEANEHE